MSYSFTQSERINFSTTAGSYDAPNSYPDNTYVLAEGISNTGYGALVTNSLSDADVYNLGVLGAGNYTVSVDGHTWDYTNWMLGGFSSFSVYNNSGVLLDTSTYGDISFAVQSNDSYYVKVKGSYGLDKQYSLYYIYDGTIQVTNANTAPVALDFTVTIFEDASSNGYLTSGAYDPDGDAILYGISINSPHSHGAATLDQSTGYFTYIPDENYFGLDRVTYYVYDGVDFTYRSVDVTVNSVNDAPTGSVIINGTPVEGERLLVTNTLADVDGLSAFNPSYQWLRDDSIIAGAVTSSYTLTQHDIGSVITVKLNYVDDTDALETIASAGTDVVTAISNSNMFIGTDGNDLLEGQVGNDEINGGEGIDTVIYNTNRSNFSLTISEGVVTLIDNVNLDGTDILSNVERLKFTDINVAIDINSNAGIVVKTLGAVFGADSISNKNFVGIGLNLLDNGMSYETLMGLALNVVNAITNEDVVDLLWENLFGVKPTDNQAAEYVNLLGNNTFTKGQLGVLAANQDLNVTNIDLVGLTQTGIEYAFIV